MFELSMFRVSFDVGYAELTSSPENCHIITAGITRIGFAKVITSYSDFASDNERATGLAMMAIGLAGEVMLCSYIESEH